ncbi:MAG TPA: bifunctional homocysteine S-methyltransferase/methylenetetrahydrofolate reductase [Chthonomonadales bacterium]|nr:bifunctional homocysteine S-methyltransferase/methylenetetrahydrofolate reductase [Chthonomonadales bacterium]
MLSAPELRERLRNAVMVADGAMGTVLQTRGIAQPYELLNVTSPELVELVHRSYAAAGASVIETHTFGANRVKLSAFALESRTSEINAAAVRVARRAAEGTGALVAGSIGPCGKALAPVGAIAPRLAEQAFREQAEALLTEGVDFLLLETFNDLDELRIAHAVARSLADVALVAQKVFIEDGDTLTAGLPARFAAEVGAWEGVAAVGANCAIGPQRMVEVVRQMAAATDTPVSAMPTPGLPQRVGAEVRYAVTPAYFGEIAPRLVAAGASLVGGCCGTGPEHIAAIARSLRSIAPRPRQTPPRSVLVVDREPAAEAPTQPLSAFRAKLGVQYVAAVELDIPRGLDVDRVLAGARALRAAGIDIIDISDGARARLRMAPVAVAHRVQTEAGIDVMMHFACRDRNLLAVQADLLAAHALGVRHILAVTGDPANIGDYPSATSVYDIDSIGLVRVLRRFNEGLDLAGNSIGSPTSFTIAAAFDPLAPDLADERDRLARKVQEGTHVVYTQPIFERAVLDVAVESAAREGVPLLFGLLPLRSARHCEFMHNEVPGIRIPERIRQRIAELSEEGARRYGIDEARELLAVARDSTAGVYLMPPFGNHRVAEAVLRGILPPKTP